jgi:hypothetical protein
MDDKLITNVSELVNQIYTYLLNYFQNSIISEFIGIVLTLDIIHWSAFLFLLAVAVLVFIYKKVSTKQLSDSPCYIGLDNLYENHNHFMGLVLFASLVFVPYSYNVTGHEVKFLKYIGLGILGILVCYLVWIPIYITRYLLVLKWKQETLKLFENSEFVIFDCHKSEVIKYTWKEKEAEKLYSAFIAKISSSQKILENELEYYKKGLNKDKVTDSYLNQSRTAIIHVDSKENSLKSEDKPIKSVKKPIILEEQQVNPPKEWTIANHFCFWIVTIIALTIAWKEGGWWWLFAFFIMGCVINYIEEKDKPKGADVTNKPINEDIKSKDPALSALAEQKITKPSVPVLQNDSNNKTEPKSKESSPAFGIWTFIAFAIAFFAGGFWWVFAIGMGLAWIGKKNENKEEETNVQVATPVINTNIPTNNLSDWAKQLTDICAQYSGNDYYVAELIPQHKLKNAMKIYPISSGGTVIALIDATVFGSASNGMAIGEMGISWHDDLSMKNKTTSMNWDDFSIQEIKRDGLKIILGDGNIFDMGGSTFDKDKVVTLLKSIQKAYLIKEPKLQLNNNNAFVGRPTKSKKDYLTGELKQRSNQNIVNSDNWVEQLANICSNYSATGFYVGESIPQKNLKYAINEYPTPDNGKIIGLFDATTLGSIQGMAIGEYGVSWHNRKSYGYGSYLWKDFAHKIISLDGSILRIGKSGIFELKIIGHSEFNNIVVELLQSIQHAYLVREKEHPQPEDLIDQLSIQLTNHKKNDFIPKLNSVNLKNTPIDVNLASFDVLLGLPGIGAAEAKSLIIEREKIGFFNSFDQVSNFLKLKPHHANQWKSRIIVKPNTSSLNLSKETTPERQVHKPLGGRTID